MSRSFVDDDAEPLVPQHSPAAGAVAAVDAHGAG